jgi:hypothetical protein
MFNITILILLELFEVDYIARYRYLPSNKIYLSILIDM